jgi:hypothetical protein
VAAQRESGYQIATPIARNGRFIGVPNDFTGDELPEGLFLPTLTGMVVW